MFNARWLLLILLMALIGLAMQQPGLLMLAALLGTIVPLAWLWAHYALSRVQYERHFSERRVFAGEQVELALQVTNRKLLPLSWLRIVDQFPKGINLLEEETTSSSNEVHYLVNALSLRWYERVRWISRLSCEQRGYYHFGPARLASGDLFGLFQQQGEQPQQDYLIVYPQVKPLEAFDLPTKELFGDIRAELRMFEDPSRVVGIRDYGPGDPFKQIHWKATARRHALQVKVYEPTTTAQVLLMLNIATLPKYWQGIVRERLEYVISLAASLANQATEKRFQIGVVANGCWPLSEQPLRVLPSRDPAQLTHVLEALAAVSSMPTLPFEDMLMREAPHLPWGATLVLITSVMTEPIAAAMVKLRQAGRRLLLISLDGEPWPGDLAGIQVYQGRPWLGDGEGKGGVR